MFRALKDLRAMICIFRDAQLKGTIPQNMSILKSGDIGHINSLNIGRSNKFLTFLTEVAISAVFLVPENLSPLNVEEQS